MQGGLGLIYIEKTRVHVGEGRLGGVLRHNSRLCVVE